MAKIVAGHGSDGQHGLVGAYVLDAIPAAERVEFDRHLGSCDQCREDVRGLREATARLAAAASIPPRPELREQTVQLALRTRQLPPLVPAESDQPHAAAPGALRRRPWESRKRPGAASAASGSASSGSAPQDRLASTGARHAAMSAVRSGTRGLRSWSARLVLAAAVLLAVAATVLGLHLGSMQNRIGAAQQRDNAIAAIVGAGDAKRMTAPVSTGGMATVVMSHHAAALVFVASHLTALPPSQRYELWLMSPSGSAPAGMLGPAQHGMSGPMVVRQVAPGDRLAVTVEPASGAARPTSAPIVSLALGG